MSDSTVIQSTRTKIRVSVVVPVKNEADNIEACLARLTRFAEVVVIDSDSTDGTAELAAVHGARVINFVWDGRWPKKRNWVLLNQNLACEWVLFLDADEFVTDAFIDAIQEAVNDKRYAGYWLNYSNYFLGKRLRFGIPQRKLALFKVGRGLYERIDEEAWSKLDMEVHEHPIVEGAVGEISEAIDHRDDRGIIKFIDRHRDYALWEARRVQQVRLKSAEEFQDLTSRQRIKYKHIESWWYPFFYFGFQYFVRLGFLDGHAGFQYAFYKLWYFSTVRLLCKSPQQQGRTGDVG